jgi:hypothetical protein
MNRLFLRIILALFLVPCAPVFSPAQPCNGCLPWAEGYQLAWEDFKAQPNPECRMLDNFNVAVTYDYTRNDSGNIVFDVHCYFVCDESWRVKERVRPYMLEHIQGNFDIGEVYARKLKQELTNFTASANYTKNKIRWVYKKNEEDRLAFNALYDIETNHGYYFKEQEAWNQKIAALLGGLRQYASK